MSMAIRASDWAGSFAMTLPGTLASPVRCNRYSNEEKPLSTAICSARTPVTVAPSTRVSHLPSSSSTVEGTSAVAEVTVDPTRRLCRSWGWVGSQTTVSFRVLAAGCGVGAPAPTLDRLEGLGDIELHGFGVVQRLPHPLLESEISCCESQLD